VIKVSLLGGFMVFFRFEVQVVEKSVIT